MRWLFNLILVLAPILSSYSIYSGVDLGSMSIAILLPFLFVFHRRSLKWPKFYFLFLFYVIFDSLLILGNVPLRICLYSFILVGGCMYLDKKIFTKLYDIFLLICSSFFIIQLIFHYLIGRNIPGIFSFLPTIYGEGRDVISLQLEAERLSSLFLEPSYFAQYIYPYLCINLLTDRTRRGLYKSIFMSVILVLLRSGVGYLLLVIIWVSWFLLLNIDKRLKIRISILIFLSVLALANTTNIIDYVIARSSEFSIEENVGEKYMSSGFLRFFNGYFIYENLLPINKFFGINPDELRSSVFYNGTFLNGISTILIMEGVLGLIMFIPHLMRLYYRNCLTTKVLVLCIITLLFAEAYFPTCRMQFAMVIAYSYSNQNLIKA